MISHPGNSATRAGQGSDGLKTGCYKNKTMTPAHNATVRQYRRMEALYTEALRTIPAPGDGCHPALLSVANRGIIAGKDPHDLQGEIRQSIPAGSRQVSDREINDTINKAVADHQGGTFTPRPRPTPIIRNKGTALQGIIKQGKYDDEVDLWESSPIRIWDEPKDHTALLLSTLFESDDFVWIGDRNQPGIMGETIRTVSEWNDYFKNGGATSPHIIINPLTGNLAPKKSGDGETYRGDGNVREYRYCLIEFDNLSREEQIRFWSAVKLPIVALIDTAGKSIHAWISVSKLVQVNTPDEWQSNIKGQLYDRVLTPLGVDAACSNAARLSRLPGHHRAEKDSMQRLLWLSPEGGQIC